jgi:hypothetical protein
MRLRVDVDYCRLLQRAAMRVGGGAVVLGGGCSKLSVTPHTTICVAVICYRLDQVSPFLCCLFCSTMWSCSRFLRHVLYIAWHLQKKTAESINSRLALVMKSGKASLGYQQTLKALRDGKGMVFAFQWHTYPPHHTSHCG